MEMQITANSTTSTNNDLIKGKSTITDIVTSTQMMGMRSGDPPFKNHSNVLVWTDHDDQDSFSLVLKRRLSYLTDLCPILQECTFNFDKHSSNGVQKADIVVIASKRHFPYGGSKSGKTWTLILPDPDYHRAWLRNGSKRQLELKLLISYLPSATWPLIKATFLDRSSTNSDEAADATEAALVATAKSRKVLRVSFCVLCSEICSVRYTFFVKSHELL